MAGGGTGGQGSQSQNGIGNMTNAKIPQWMQGLQLGQQIAQMGQAKAPQGPGFQPRPMSNIGGPAGMPQGGVVPGAGLSLARLKTSSELLNEAFQYPYRQLMDNMSLEREPNLIASKSWAINVRTGKKGPYMQVGVSDPVDVLIAGIESAVSIASLLVTTSGMIVESVVDIKHE